MIINIAEILPYLEVVDRLNSRIFEIEENCDYYIDLRTTGSAMLVTLSSGFVLWSSEDDSMPATDLESHLRKRILEIGEVVRAIGLELNKVD